MNVKPYSIIFFLAGSVFAQTDPVVIRGARVIDGTGAPARDVLVVIRGGKIEAVGGSAPAGARVIDASGQTLLPGLFDLHTHLTASATSGVAGDWGKNLKAYLANGVTTVNDYATFGEMFAPMKKLLESGATPGPHVNMAVRMSSTGGHGTEAGWGDFMTIEANTPAQAHARIKAVLAYKPDVIKVFTDGWRYGAAPDLNSMNLETLTAIVEDAHAANIKVVTHTVTLRGAKLAARAGVDILVHGIGDAEVDSELIEIMKAKGTYYVSTLAVYEYKGTGDAPPERQVRWRNLTANVRKLFQAGIPIGVGTDAGMPSTFHGQSTVHEFELLVQLGLKPMEAIRAGTSVSARAMGLDGQRGTIAPGKQADLVLVEGRPDEQIADLKKTRRVFAGGKEYDPGNVDSPPLPVRAAGELVDDMERTDGRTQLGTLRVNATDAGVDHSPMLFHPVIRAGKDHALLVQATMAEKDRPWVRVDFPLTPGGVELADVSKYSGVQFEIRGEAVGRLISLNYGVTTIADPWAAPFVISTEWSSVRVPFTSLKRRAADQWIGRDVRTIAFELSGPSGSGVWIELDNVRFY
jgi:imidazolonepropionase-like amidohydrolase